MLQKFGIDFSFEEIRYNKTTQEEKLLNVASIVCCICNITLFTQGTGKIIAAAAAAAMMHYHST